MFLLHLTMLPFYLPFAAVKRKKNAARSTKKENAAKIAPKRERSSIIATLFFLQIYLLTDKVGCDLIDFQIFIILSPLL